MPKLESIFSRFGAEAKAKEELQRFAEVQARMPPVKPRRRSRRR
jgi:hypothetical protein